MIFRKCTELCNRDHKLGIEHFHHPSKMPCAYLQLMPVRLFLLL